VAAVMVAGVMVAGVMVAGVMVAGVMVRTGIVRVPTVGGCIREVKGVIERAAANPVSKVLRRGRCYGFSAAWTRPSPRKGCPVTLP
jgi:hypothetical protein